MSSLFKLPTFIAALALLSLSACSYRTFYVPTNQNVYPSVDPKTIPVSAQKTISLKHRIIGRVAVLRWGGGENAREAIQEEAGRIGANAVIDLRLERGWGRTSASGLAVFIFDE
jgi:hypothetical protein